jgi:hypothetical protein
MTNRTVSLLLLFVIGFLISGVVSALAISLAARAELPTRIWIVPLILFVTYVTVFFSGRQYILPHEIASSSVRALLVIAGWIGTTMLLVGAAVWAIRGTPLGVFLSAGTMTLAWFLLLLGSGVALANRAARRDRALP